MADKTDLAAGSQVPASWWRDGVLYQIYPRSFADSDGDGIGDLAGIRERLDHLAWLGVTGIWLNPTMPSPNDDWGYDVADYCAVHPDLGTMEDLDALIAAARERGIRVLLDLVPNHTSDRHPWFADALTGRDARHRDFYVWAPPGAGRRPAEQLDLELRRLGVDVARAHGRVLPRPVPADAARPQLVERGGPRALRRHPALLVCARRRGLSDRRLPRDRQGPRAARRPAGDARRPPRAAAPHGQARLLGQPPGGARRPAPLAHGRRRARRAGARRTARRRSSSARRTCSSSTSSCPSTARVATSCTWPSTSSSSTPTSTPRRCARSSRASRPGCRPTRGRSTPAPTTTPAASPRAGRWTTSGAPARRC